MKKSFIALLILLFSINLNAQSIKSMEFHNQEITDILLVLAQSSGTSIIPDETVTGKASFYFSESSLESALSTFLTTYKLYYEKNDNFITVSKIKASFNKDTGLASVKADDVSIESILRKLSGKIGRTILYDSLPTTFITVDIENLSVEEILKICIKKLPDYFVETSESYYYVKRYTEKPTTQSSKKNAEEVLVKNGNLYSLNLDKGRFLEILQKLFVLEGIEYSLFVQSDTQIENLHFANKDFQTMLQLLLEQGNADYVEKNGIYYIINLQKKGISAKLKTTQVINLKWIQAQDIVSLIPTELASTTAMKIDKNSNTIFLTGTQEETTPIKDFIEKIDIPLSGMKYKTFEIKYLDSKDVISLIPPKMIQFQPSQIPGTNSLLVSGTDETLKNLEVFINEIDVKKSGIPIKLKYIQTETLLKNIPPSIKKESIVDSGFPNLVFYIGSEENKDLFMHELNMIDKPQPQIKYQLMVIQYTKGKETSLKPSFSVKKTDNEENFVFGGELSNLLDISFDIITEFGYEFAVNLNTKVGNKTANIFTDTTLTAISGQEIKFQNTDTYRYLEYDYDTSSSTRSSITQQITSGLIVNLKGWVSGDNMITMSVNATVSKQNGDNSSNATATSLPSTSERVITTQVRSMSGEPVVISGLMKEDYSESDSGVPLLSKIPLLGKLFKHSSKSKEKTEIVIYIVPHLIQETGSLDNESFNLERYYQRFMSN